MFSMINENIYGHAKRLEWIRSNLRPSDKILEFGCGTGYMITLPLIKEGYSVTGIDLDSKSIDYGRDLFAREGVNPGSLQNRDIEELDVLFDVIIASEVLEHIPDSDLEKVFASILSKLRPGGMFLVTVPNGYGWFELESFLWFKTGIGRVLELLRIDSIVRSIKRNIFRIQEEDMTLVSSLAQSPHVQRFTYSRIKRLLNDNGLAVRHFKGSVLFCGPFSNLFFTGMHFIMKFNNRLGDKMPKSASAFYILARKK